PADRFGPISGMIETAENLAREYSISREAADEYSVRSHHRAAAAWESGKFAAEVVPITVPQKKGDPIVFARDEGVRANASMDSVSKLKRSEEHTSELQSLRHLVCRLLLEK